jgi:hypothetical protein
MNVNEVSGEIVRPCCPSCGGPLFAAAVSPGVPPVWWCARNGVACSGVPLTRVWGSRAGLPVPVSG